MGGARPSRRKKLNKEIKMLGLKLRPEFAASTISGTVVSLDSKYSESFVNLPTAKALDVTYPSVDLIQAI